MKKLLLLITTATILTGCYVSRSAYDELYYTDFTKYAQDEFFVSSITDYTGSEYVALGDVAIASYPEIGATNYNYSAQKMLDKLVRHAKEKGANGVIGYSTKHIPGNEHTREYWFISGVAVLFEKLPAQHQTEIFAPKDSGPKDYNFEKARKDAQAENKPIIGEANNNGYIRKVYYDPEIGLYQYRNDFEKKYGYDVIPKLEKENY